MPCGPGSKLTTLCTRYTSCQNLKIFNLLYNPFYFFFSLPHPIQVLRVRAVDGDRGVNNPVVYSLARGNPASRLFAINADTGVVYTKAELDREASSSSSSSAADGAYILEVEAREVGQEEDGEELVARVEVTVVLEVRTS